jgi:hypothetical protein
VFELALKSEKFGFVLGTLDGELKPQLGHGRNMEIKQALQQLVDGDSLSREDMRDVMTAVMTGLTAAYPLFLGVYVSRRKIAEDVETWDLIPD